MTPYYENGGITIYHADCREVLPWLRGVECLVADPPYGIGKAEWDWITDYLPWSAEWINLASSALLPNGNFWCFHSNALVLADLARVIASNGRPCVSFLTLDKSWWSLAKRYPNAGSASFPAAAEYATYHRRAVFIDELRAMRDSLGLSRGDIDTAVSPSRKPTGLCYRWEAGDCIPGEGEVKAIRERFGVALTLPIFSNGAKHPTVWEFPAPSERIDHPTPKPLTIISRVVAATSLHGGLVVDPFMGSGTTLLAAKNLGRLAIGIELEERYCEIAAKRLAQGVLPLEAA